MTLICLSPQTRFSSSSTISSGVKFFYFLYLRFVNVFYIIEGCIVAKKDYSHRKHDALPVRNLHVVKLLQSLKSKGYVKEQFNWQYLYYFLNDKGIEYLRGYLHLGNEEVPSTHKKPANTRPSSYVDERRNDERRPRRNFDSKKVAPSSGEIGFVNFLSFFNNFLIS